MCFAEGAQGVGGVGADIMELEQKNQYKDLDVLEDTVGIKKYIRGLIRKGKDRKEIISKTVEKFEVPKKRIRELYRECNGKGQ